MDYHVYWASLVGFVTVSLIVLTLLFVGFRPHPKQHADKKKHTVPKQLDGQISEPVLTSQNKLVEETVVSAFDLAHGLGLAVLNNGQVGTLQVGTDNTIFMTKSGVHHEYEGIPRDCDIVPGTDRAWIRTDAGVDVLYLTKYGTWHRYHHEPGVFSATVTKTSDSKLILATEKNWLDVSEVAVAKRNAATRGMWPKSVREYMALTPGVIRVRSDGSAGHVTLSNPNQERFAALTWYPDGGQFGLRWTRDIPIFDSLVSADLKVIGMHGKRLVVLDPEEEQVLHVFSTSSVHLTGSRPHQERLLAVQPDGTGYLWRLLNTTNLYVDAPAEEPLVLKDMTDVTHVSKGHLLNRDHLYTLT